MCITYDRADVIKKLIKNDIEYNNVCVLSADSCAELDILRLFIIDSKKKVPNVFTGNEVLNFWDYFDNKLDTIQGCVHVLYILMSEDPYYNLLCFHELRCANKLQVLPKDLIRFLKDFIY